MEYQTFRGQTKQFMYSYMFELEFFLKSIKDELKEITFQSDEANTDRPLKEFLKLVIENRFNKPSHSQIKTLTLTDSINNLEIECQTYSTLYISHVYLPDELTNEIKSIVSKEKGSAVYTNPDMCFEITDGTNITYETVELKSTKNDSIPGSSIQQILPEEWVIFIKHTTTDISIATGQYIHAINSKMQFPDRSPRPQVSFSEVENWNHTNRRLLEYSLLYEKASDEQMKYELINDWQTYLSNRWIDVIFSSTTKNNEPWFNNNLRKFVVSFLDKYESLSTEEQALLREKIKSLIQ